MHAHGAVFAEGEGRPRSRPDPGDPPRRRLRRRPRHQPAPGAEASNYGGMIWGVSFALHEHAVADPRSGRLMNPNLAEYHRSGERRPALDRGDPDRGARSPRERARQSRASARSGSPAPRAPSPTRSGMRRASGFATSRSPWIGCWFRSSASSGLLSSPLRVCSGSTVARHCPRRGPGAVFPCSSPGRQSSGAVAHRRRLGVLLSRRLGSTVSCRETRRLEPGPPSPPASPGPRPAGEPCIERP